MARDSSVAVLVGRSASRALRRLSVRAKVTGRLRRVRDALIREAIVYAPVRGRLAFTVPHCARFLRQRYG